MEWADMAETAVIVACVALAGTIVNCLIGAFNVWSNARLSGRIQADNARLNGRIQAELERFKSTLALERSSTEASLRVLADVELQLYSHSIQALSAVVEAMITLQERAMEGVERGAFDQKTVLDAMKAVQKGSLYAPPQWDRKAIETVNRFTTVAVEVGQLTDGGKKPLSAEDCDKLYRVIGRICVDWDVCYNSWKEEIWRQRGKLVHGLAGDEGHAPALEVRERGPVLIPEKSTKDLMSTRRRALTPRARSGPETPPDPDPSARFAGRAGLGGARPLRASGGRACQASTAARGSRVMGTTA
jgi:hypothetical protein